MFLPVARRAPPDIAVVALIAVVFWTVFLLVAHACLRLAISYELTKEAVRVLVLRSAPIKTIPYSEITEVQAVGFWRLLSPEFFVSIRGGNRIFVQRGVVVRRRGKLTILMTPDDPDAFVAEVRQRCAEVGASR
jgi:hypothetical protein